MSLLSEIKPAVESCGLSVETGVFSGTPPDKYVVVTPLGDSFGLHADNAPEYETQEARLSLFVKGNCGGRTGGLPSGFPLRTGFRFQRGRIRSRYRWM